MREKTLETILTEVLDGKISATKAAKNTKFLKGQLLTKYMVGTLRNMEAKLCFRLLKKVTLWKDWLRVQNGASSKHPRLSAKA